MGDGGGGRKGGKYKLGGERGRKGGNISWAPLIWIIQESLVLKVDYTM